MFPLNYFVSNAFYIKFHRFWSEFLLGPTIILCAFMLLFGKIHAMNKAKITGFLRPSNCS